MGINSPAVAWKAGMDILLIQNPENHLDRVQKIGLAPAVCSSCTRIGGKEEVAQKEDAPGSEADAIRAMSGKGIDLQKISSTQRETLADQIPVAAHLCGDGGIR